jgi:hypothetical protein
MAQGSGKPYNVPTTGSGDHVVIPGVTGLKNRLRSINIQNQDASTDTNITIKQHNEASGETTVLFGPLLVAAKQLLPVQDYQLNIALSAGDDLVINSSANVQLLTFGIVEPC